MLIIKGVAILFMLYLHLFSMEKPIYEPLFYIDNEPFETYLLPFTQPVDFFLLVSGYGLHVIYTRGTKDTHKWSRILYLFLHWWIILSIYIIVSQIIGSGLELDVENVIRNFTAFDTTWYHPGWFLFPYVCLSLLSPYLFKIITKMKVWTCVIGFYVLGLGMSFVISRNNDYIYSHRIIFNILGTINLMPAFILGAMLHRMNAIVVVQKKLHSSKWVWCILILFVIVKCVIRTSIIGVFYPVTFTLLFLSAPRWIWIDNILCYLGKHSMDMWLIHAWLYYYLFKAEFYSLRYPIIIFVTLVIASLLCSYLIKWISEAMILVVDRKRWLIRT